MGAKRNSLCENRTLCLYSGPRGKVTRKAIWGRALEIEGKQRRAEKRVRERENMSRGAREGDKNAYISTSVALSR